jgi:hypothetical protein
MGAVEALFPTVPTKGNLAVNRYNPDGSIFNPRQPSDEGDMDKMPRWGESDPRKQAGRQPMKSRMTAMNVDAVGMARFFTPSGEEEIDDVLMGKFGHEAALERQEEILRMKYGDRPHLRIIADSNGRILSFFLLPQGLGDTDTEAFENLESGRAAVDAEAQSSLVEWKRMVEAEAPRWNTDVPKVAIIDGRADWDFSDAREGDSQNVSIIIDRSLKGNLREVKNRVRRSRIYLRQRPGAIANIGGGRSAQGGYWRRFGSGDPFHLVVDPAAHAEPNQPTIENKGAAWVEADKWRRSDYNARIVPVKGGWRVFIRKRNTRWPQVWR